MKKAIFYILLVGLIAAHDMNLNAQGIVLDGTVGSAENPELQGPNYAIGAEYDRQAGANLFHSFTHRCHITGLSWGCRAPAR